MIPPALPPRQAAAQAVPQTGSEASPPEATAVEPAIGATTAALTPSLFASLATRARHDWMLLAGGLSGGVLLGAVIWLVVWMSSPSPTIVADAPQSAAPPVSTLPPKVDTPPEEAAVTEPAPQRASTESAPAPVAAPISDPQSPATAEKLPAPGATPSSDEAAVAKETPPVEPAPAPAATEAPAESPAPALKLEPIAPNAISASSAPSERLPAAGEDITGTPKNSAGEPSADEPSADSSSLDNVDASELNVRDGHTAPKKLTTAEIEKRLSVPLERVEFVAVPLAQFAAFIGDVTGVPVVLDDTVRVHIGKNRKTPIDVKLTGTTAAAALRAASQRAGLVYAIEDGRILISAAKR